MSNDTIMRYCEKHHYNYPAPFGCRQCESEAAQGEVEELRHALRLAQDAMRAPIDDWKGELERKALDACRRALAPKAEPLTGGS